MQQNYVRRLLKRPHPQMLTHDAQRRSSPDLIQDYWQDVRRAGRCGKTPLLVHELERRILKKGLFTARYGAPPNVMGSTQSSRRATFADIERLWQSTNSVWATKELRDNAFGGGL